MKTFDHDYSTAARFTESEEPQLIAKVEANQAWKDYTTRKAATNHTGHSENQDSDLVTVLLPTLDQIIQAVNAEINNFTIGCLILPPSCQTLSHFIWELITNCSHPESGQIFLPPIKDYGYYAACPFLPSFRAAPIAYNLTTPGTYGYQELNPYLWPDSSQKILPDYKEDPSFMLYIDFERSFLRLSFSSLEWMALSPKTETTSMTRGSDRIFTNDEGNPVSSAEAVIILSDFISKFISDHITAQELENLRAVILAGGASDIAVDAMRTALHSVPYFRGAKIAVDIDPSYVPSLGGANWILQRERLIRRDPQRKEDERQRGYKEEL